MRKDGVVYGRRGVAKWKLLGRKEGRKKCMNKERKRLRRSVRFEEGWLYTEGTG